MNRTLPRLVAALGAAAIVLGGATACFSPVVAPVETPKPSGFGGIGGTPTVTPTGDPVQPETPTGDLVSLVDDTQHLTVQVPASWSDVDGSPFTDGNGVAWIAITAAPNIDDYYSRWDVPGVDVYATDDPSVTVEDLLPRLGSAFDEPCTVEDFGTSYSDSVYTGIAAAYTGCGGTDTAVLTVAAAADDGTHVVGIIIQAVTTDDQTVVTEAILNSFLASF